MGWWNSLRLHLDGQRQLDQNASRGRVYEKRKSGPGGTHVAEAKPVATLHMKITRANGTVEEVEVPAIVESA